MRRGGPLRRTTGLKTFKALTRTSPLNPGRGLSRQREPISRATPLRWKPKPPSEQKRDAKKLLEARADGRCEGCGRPGPADPSHRVRSGQGGPWHVSNLLALCRRDHDWLHDNETEAREQLGWCLKSRQNFLTEPTWLWGRGWCLLLPDGSVQVVSEIPDSEAS